MFKKISKHESYWGTVESVEDPLKAGRLKIRVDTVFNELSIDAIPWAESGQDVIEHDLPAVGDTVFVKFPHDVAYMPFWYRRRSQYDGKIIPDDYETATVLVEKDLQRYNEDAKLRICYAKSEGIVVELEIEGKLSEIIIKPDNTILLKNGKSGQSVHLADDNISIGRETKSQQPAVVGNDNQSALEKLNDEIKELSEIMNINLKLISTICGTISPLKPLKPLFSKYATEVKTKINTIHSTNANFFPETKSTVVTVDKTKP